MIKKAKQFKKYPWNFFWQPLLAAFFVVLMLVALGGFKHIDLLGFIGIGSLGSSAFLLFSLPHKPVANLEKLYGGYFICILSGVVFSAVIYFIVNHLQINKFIYVEIIAAIAMATSMFFMSLFGLEHPSAVGLTLGLVVQQWTTYSLVIMILVILLMGLLRGMLRNKLIDLV